MGLHPIDQWIETKTSSRADGKEAEKGADECWGLYNFSELGLRLLGEIPWA